MNCAEIANMVNVNVPIDIVVQMIDESGGVAPGTLSCVQAKGLPAQVVEAVERATVEPTPAGDSPSSRRVTDVVPAVPPPPPPEEARGLSPRRAARVLLVSDAGGADYYLARALDELGLVHAAERRYARASAHGDAWSEAALLDLAVVAERTGDWDEADGILAGMAVDRVPRGLRGRAYLLDGLRHADAGQRLEARTSLDKVPESSSAYPTARFAYGVVTSWGCIRKSVLRAWFEAARDDGPVADLARIDIARAYVDIGQHEEGLPLYDLVPPNSTFFPRAQLEAAWADFHLGDDVSALARLSRARAIPLGDGPPAAFEPEAPVLAALILGDHCEYVAARKVLGGFEAWAAAPGELRRPNGARTRIEQHLAAVEAERDGLRGPLRALEAELTEEGERLEVRAAEAAREEQAWAEAKLAEQVDQARIIRAELDRSERAGERILSSGGCPTEE